MELRSLQSPTVSSIPRSGLIDKSFAYGHVIKFPNNKNSPDARTLKLLYFRTQASGAIKSSSVAVEAIPKDTNSKDENLIFVAGATGRVGSRTVRELLKLGCKVRAGVRSVERAESLVKSVQQMKFDESGVEGTQPIEKLEIVECDLEKQDRIGPALGNASIVICCIGASEKEIFDVTGPCRIDYRATKNLIDAATVAKVNHFILLTSLGTNKVGFPAAILNLFWGVLIWKRKAEEVLLASGIPYTIVRPGGMERPTDSYKETHNISLSQEDTLFGGQVSNLQVAELMAFMAKNRSLSCCKVVEVIAETTAPLTPMGELLAKIPSKLLDVDLEYCQEPGAADGPVPSTEKEPTQENATATSYDDLKPPVSPTPKAPGGLKEDANIIDEASQTSVMIARPLSPYTVYDDLKPPTSPSPSSPKISLTSPVNGGSQMAAMSGNSTAQLPTADKSGNKQQHAEPNSRPLSPFTMYEDLKPPTSPTPSPRKL